MCARALANGSGWRAQPVIGVHGDEPMSFPPEVLDELINRNHLHGKTVEELISDEDRRVRAETITNTAFIGADTLTNRRRRQELRAAVEDPLPYVHRPLTSLFAHIVGIDSVRNMTAAGKVDTQRAVVVVGDGRGVVGYGIAKGGDFDDCVKLAMQNARRDLIHIPTHNGQLYTDLCGHMNSTRVVLRSMAPAKGANTSPLIGTVLGLAGITNVSSKIHGPGKNVIIVLRALFDCFHSCARAAAARWVALARATPLDITRARTRARLRAQGPAAGGRGIRAGAADDVGHAGSEGRGGPLPALPQDTAIRETSIAAPPFGERAPARNRERERERERERKRERERARVACVKNG